MKKFTLILLLLVLAGPVLKAQEPFPRSQFSLRYGLITNADIIEATSSLLTSVITFGEFETRNNHTLGTFGLEYQYRLKKWVSIGASASYEWTACDLYSKKLDIDAGDIVNHYYTVMATARFNYLSKNIITLYSRVGFGVTFWFEYITGDAVTSDNSSSFIAFQVTPFGIHIGNKIGGFAEVGVGSEGMFSAGLDFRF
jgi:hypothetical protein